jgi:MFS transporter, OFA family, oxalate/formate antiporter
MMLLMILCSSGYGLFVASVFKSYGSIDQSADFSDTLLTTIGSVGILMNGISRLFWALLMDKFGFKPIYLIICSLQILIIFLLPQIHTDKVLYFIWISASFFIYGGHYSIFPTFAAKLYGPETAAKVYPLTFWGFALSTIIGVVLSKVLIPMYHD